MKAAVAAVLALFVAACGAPAAKPFSQAAHRIAYGAAPSQYGELWMPKGPGPFPVVVLIHGGCWLAVDGDLAMTTPLARDLQQRGYAVWNMQYARVGEPGVAYPRTFTDVAAGVDHLRVLARSYPLDLKRVVAVGHSAGGHLALWAAARRRLPAGSPLTVQDPVVPKAVVSLAGIGDLHAYTVASPDVCGPATIPTLTGRGRPDPYADTSPVRMLPLGATMLIVSGGHDDVVPPSLGEAFAAAARAKGDAAEHMVIARASHMQVIDPRGEAWARTLPVLERLSR